MNGRFTRKLFLILLLLLFFSGMASAKIIYSKPSPAILGVQAVKNFVVVTDKGNIQLDFNNLGTATTFYTKLGSQAYKYWYQVNGLSLTTSYVFNITIPNTFEWEGCYDNGHNVTECDLSFVYGDLVLDYNDIANKGFKVWVKNTSRNYVLYITVDAKSIKNGGVEIEPIVYGASTINVTAQNVTLLDINNSIANETCFCCYLNVNANYRYNCVSSCRLIFKNGGVLNMNNDNLTFNYSVNTNLGMRFESNGNLSMINNSLITTTGVYTQIRFVQGVADVQDSRIEKLGLGTGNDRFGFWYLRDGLLIRNTTFFDSNKHFIVIGSSTSLASGLTGVPSNDVVINNTINVSTGLRGIGLTGCLNCTIVNNSITTYSGECMQLNRLVPQTIPLIYIYVRYSNISNNYCNSNNKADFGIRFLTCEECNHNFLLSNQITNIRTTAGTQGIYLQGTNNTVSYNNISNLGYQDPLQRKWGSVGIYLDNVNNSYFEWNDFDNIGETDAVHTAFYLLGAFNNVFVNQSDVLLDGYGTQTNAWYLLNSNNNSIDNGFRYVCQNQINKYGFFMQYSHNNSFKNINAQCNSSMAEILYSDNNTFEYGTATVTTLLTTISDYVRITNSTGNIFKDMAVTCSGLYCGAGTHNGYILVYNYGGDVDCWTEDCHNFVNTLMNVTSYGGDNFGSGYVLWTTTGFETVITNYVRAFVNDTLSNPLSNILVNWYNKTNTLFLSELTNALGYTQWNNLTRFVVNRTTRIEYTNYSANASLTSYYTNSSSFNFSYPTTINLTLYLLPITCPKLSNPSVQPDGFTMEWFIFLLLISGTLTYSALKYNKWILLLFSSTIIIITGLIIITKGLLLKSGINLINGYCSDGITLSYILKSFIYLQIPFRYEIGSILILLGLFLLFMPIILKEELKQLA